MWVKQVEFQADQMILDLWGSVISLSKRCLSPRTLSVIRPDSHEKTEIKFREKNATISAEML